MPTAPTAVTTRELLDRHEGILLDLYGVLLDASGARPGAHELVAELVRRKRPYAFVSNDASRSPETYVTRFAALGMHAEPSQFVTSGSLIAGYFADKHLAGARTAVLGTPDSHAYVRQAGGELVPLARGMDFDVLVVGDDDGFPFLDGMEWTFSALARAIDTGRRPTLLLPNPDLIYPKGGTELGFTAGAIALLIEAGLARRFPRQGLRFDHLGKPEPHLMHAGAARLGIPIDRLVMIGDQLETDIASASAAGCPSALLAGSISRWDSAAAVTPTYLLDRLW